jgi:hypothetical protein
MIAFHDTRVVLNAADQLYSFLKSLTNHHSRRWYESIN